MVITHTIPWSRRTPAPDGCNKLDIRGNSVCPPPQPRPRPTRQTPLSPSPYKNKKRSNHPNVGWIVTPPCDLTNMFKDTKKIDKKNSSVQPVIECDSSLSRAFTITESVRNSFVWKKKNTHTLTHSHTQVQIKGIKNQLPEILSATYLLQQENEMFNPRRLFKNIF